MNIEPAPVASLLIEKNYLPSSTLSSLSCTSKAFNEKVLSNHAAQLASTILNQQDKLLSLSHRCGSKLKSLPFRFNIFELNDLSLDDSTEQTQNTAQNITKILKNCPNLTHLSVSYTGDITLHKNERKFTDIILKVQKLLLPMINGTQFPKLQNLAFKNGQWLKTEDMDNFFLNLKSVKDLYHLSLKNFPLDEQHIIQLSQLSSCNSLKLNLPLNFRNNANESYLNSFKLLKANSTVCFNLTTGNLYFPNEKTIKAIQNLEMHKTCLIMLPDTFHQPTDEQILSLKDFEKVKLILRDEKEIISRISNLIPNVISKIKFIRFINMTAETINKYPVSTNPFA